MVSGVRLTTPHASISSDAFLRQELIIDQRVTGCMLVESFFDPLFCFLQGRYLVMLVLCLSKLIPAVLSLRDIPATPKVR